MVKVIVNTVLILMLVNAILFLAALAAGKAVEFRPLLNLVVPVLAELVLWADERLEAAREQRKIRFLRAL